MQKKVFKNKKLNRSKAGNVTLFIVMGLGAAFTALPLIYAIGNAFKPLNEMFLFPPQYFPRHPTFRNFSDLVILMGKSWVPISRYLFNSVFLVVFGMSGNVILGSLAAYALSKHTFPGKKLLNQLVVLSLMFSGAVTLIPNYMILSYLRLLNTYWAVIIPSWGTTLGLFLMKQFIDAMVHDSLLESARMDGANEFICFFHIAMPIVKPAWLTLVILVFQQLWGTTGGLYIYAEKLKPLPYALSQIIGGGIGRAGVAA
ncbi:MAG: carbohydrate ABC transporter permease, partial [Candidatus Brocadiales bacterium]|nr:carbohydrate ABC transporter permease [Candidatus Brocadiales bacterium]